MSYVSVKMGLTLADPGFGQGGAPEYLSEILPTKRSEVRRAKRANMALEALAFWTIKYAFSYFSWYFFSKFLL